MDVCMYVCIYVSIYACVYVGSGLKGTGACRLEPQCPLLVSARCEALLGIETVGHDAMGFDGESCSTAFRVCNTCRPIIPDPATVSTWGGRTSHGVDKARAKATNHVGVRRPGRNRGVVRSHHMKSGFPDTIR